MILMLWSAAMFENHCKTFLWTPPWPGPEDIASPSHPCHSRRWTSELEPWVHLDSEGTTNCPLKSQPTTYWQGSYHHLSCWTRQCFPIILANERLIWAIWFCNTLLHHGLKAAEHIFSYVLSIKYCSWGRWLVRFAAHKAKMERLVVAPARRGPWGQLLSVFLLMLCAPFFSGQVL